MINDWNNRDTRPESEKTRLWDSMADNFDGYSPQTRENNKIIKLIEDKKLINRDSRVLDLGCAAGKYTFYFAEHCKEVVGIDISPKMLERAEENKKRLGKNNVTFLKRDWDSFSLEDIGGSKSFDFIFANMTPAVSSKDSLLKMIDASNGWCWYGGSAGRTRTINDQVYKLFDLPLHTQGNESRIPAVFAEIWKMGLRPYLEYIESYSEFYMSLEKALIYYENAANSMLRLKSDENISHEMRAKLKELLIKNLHEDLIKEEISGNTAVLIWNTKKEEK